jgi:ubiquinone/menaquinone biosynthesis C-methylase UbiE
MVANRVFELRLTNRLLQKLISKAGRMPTPQEFLDRSCGIGVSPVKELLFWTGLIERLF